MRTSITKLLTISSLLLFLSIPKCQAKLNSKSTNDDKTVSRMSFTGHDIMDVSHLNIRNTDKIRLNLPSDGKPTHFYLKKSITSDHSHTNYIEAQTEFNSDNRIFQRSIKNNFFHGTNGHRTLTLIQSGKDFFGNVIDMESKEVHYIQPNYNGETVVFRKTAEDLSECETDYLLEKPRLPQELVSPEKDLLNRNAPPPDDGKKMDVMVVWTQAAECRNSLLEVGCELNATTHKNMMGRVNLAIYETNVALSNSWISLQLRLVWGYRHKDYVETPDFVKTLFELTSLDDDIIDDIHSYREKFGADLVSLWIDTEKCGGVSWLGPFKEYMFSVMNWKCSTGHASFAHEWGHMMGCTHDRGSMNECNGTRTNYGYRDPDAKFRDIMSYDCMPNQCDDNNGTHCLRAHYFSNNRTKYEKEYSVGTSDSNCALTLINNKLDASRFLPAKSERYLNILRRKERLAGNGY